MKKFATIAAALFAVHASTLAFGAGAADAASGEATIGHVTYHGAQKGSSTPSFTDTSMCTYDDRRGGQACGTVRLYESGPVRAEGRGGIRYAECEFKRDVKYLGWSTVDMSNGLSYRTMPSAKKPDRFHLFKITAKKITSVKGGCSFPNM